MVCGRRNAPLRAHDHASAMISVFDGTYSAGESGVRRYVSAGMRIGVGRDNDHPLRTVCSYALKIR